MRRSYLHIIMTIVLFAARTPGSLAGFDERGWLAFGELRGYFEPCGCDPEADLGGVVRQYAFLERERAIHPNLVLLNLGNNLSPHKAEAYKSQHILRAIALMKPNAYLVNETEFTNLAETLKAQLPLLLSNLRTPLKGVRNVVTVGDTDVFGYMHREAFKGQLATTNASLVEQWKKLSKQKKRVLLFSGSQTDLIFFYGTKWFNAIISANDTPLDRIVGPEEKAQEDKLIRKPLPISMVPIGGQGILRGGILLTSQAPLLKDLLDKRECKPGLLGVGDCSQQSTPTMHVEVKSVTWLDKSYRGLSTKLDPVEKAYAHASETRLSSLVDERKAQLKDTPFAGAEACKGCHAQAYEVWTKSGHAHAWATLQNKAKTKDPECVSCHVVGFKESGGFVSMNDSPQFANVQCENCHGARKDHVEDPMKHLSKNKASDVCVSCHHGSHSSNFVFDQYWLKIKHSK